MKFWKYNFNMSADCRNFLEMVLTNAVMEGETERHANAGEWWGVPEPILFLVPKKEYCSLNDVVYRESANDISEAPDLGILVHEGWRVCIRWQCRRRWVWTRWCRKWIICRVWELRTKCRKCRCNKATSSRIWTAFLIRFYEKRVWLIKVKLLLACLLHLA